MIVPGSAFIPKAPKAANCCLAIPEARVSVSQTGVNARVGYFDWDGTPVVDVSLGYSLANTIQDYSIHCLDAAEGLVLLPGDPDGYGDPMSMYRLTSAGVLTLLYTGLVSHAYKYGPNLNTGGYPFTYGGVDVYETTLSYAAGGSRALRCFRTTWLDYPCTNDVVAVEVILLSDASIVDVFTGPDSLCQALSAYPEFPNQ